MNNIGEIIKKEEEDKTYTIIDEVNKIFYIWSDILYDKKNHEPKNNFLDFKKWEEKEEFSIYEYQVQEIKEDEEFFSVILLGDNYLNIKFINGFVNFLYEVKKEYNFRFKIENKYNNIVDNKKNIDNFLEIVDIKHEKGNIKFYCFNFHAYAGLSESDV